MMMALAPSRRPATRKWVLVGIVAAWMVCFVIFASPIWILPVHHAIESIGILLVALCVCGRAFCAIYISGHKDARLIDKGPYSICRNPLYLFSIIGAAGVGASTGSIIASLTGGLLTYAVFRVVVTSEERRLAALHGDRYCVYVRRVPRFLPNFSLWEPRQGLVVNETGVLRTVADSVLFILAVPLIDTIEYLRQSGVIRALFEIP